MPRLRSDRLVSGDETLVRVLSSRIEEDEAASVSALSFLPEKDESPLACRWRPMRPSFSIATKLVRTLDSGRGDSLLASDEWKVTFSLLCMKFVK